jgi:4-hydroxybenzoate polyprenyltransferase
MKIHVRFCLWVLGKLRTIKEIVFRNHRQELLKGLITSCNLQASLYAFVLTIIGFRYYAPVAWGTAILSAIIFAGITSSIMSFNIFVDRQHDTKKGKMFASLHPRELFYFWSLLSSLTLMVLAVLFALAPAAAGLSLVVWALGLFYSFVPHWYRINNIIVAFCSASPVLAAAAHHWSMHGTTVSIFFTLFMMIMTREIYLDMRDQEYDKGYKETIPVRKGHISATFSLLGMNHFWVLPLLFYPNYGLWFWIPAGIGAAAIQAVHGLSMLHPDRIVLAKRIMNWVIRLLLVTALITQ